MPAQNRLACERILGDLKQRRLRTIAIISGTDEFGKSMRDQCVAVAPKWGITVADEESYGPRDSDVIPQLTGIRNHAEVQAVMNTGFGQGPVIVTRDYHQLNIKMPLYESHGVASKQYIELAGPGGGWRAASCWGVVGCRQTRQQRSAEASRARYTRAPSSRRQVRPYRPLAAMPTTA